MDKNLQKKLLLNDIESLLTDANRDVRKFHYTKPLHSDIGMVEFMINETLKSVGALRKLLDT